MTWGLYYLRLTWSGHDAEPTEPHTHRVSKTLGTAFMVQQKRAPPADANACKPTGARQILRVLSESWWAKLDLAVVVSEYGVDLTVRERYGNGLIGASANEDRVPLFAHGPFLHLV